MITVRVELLAFRDDTGVFRTVRLPDSVYGSPFVEHQIHNKLAAIFEFGQSTVQQPLSEEKEYAYSISAGDVIHLDSDKYLISAAGFCKMTDEEYEEYKSKEHRDRLFNAYLREHNVS